MRTAARLGCAAVAALSVSGTGYAVATPDTGAPILGPGTVRVDVTIEHSQFDLDALKVREGTLVELVVHNHDPIDHELVVGGPEVHARHEAGSEARHPPVPGEVSVAPDTTALTYYVFARAGSVEYACHLPGHAAYGMRGTIEVIPTA